MSKLQGRIIIEHATGHGQIILNKVSRFVQQQCAHTLRDRSSSSVMTGGPSSAAAAGTGAGTSTLGPAAESALLPGDNPEAVGTLPAIDAATAAATRSARACASLSACCLFSLSSSACNHSPQSAPQRLALTNSIPTCFSLMQEIGTKSSTMAEAWDVQGRLCTDVCQSER